MEVTLDSVGRVLVPKPIRTALGLQPGTKVDLSVYGSGLQLTPKGRGAVLVSENGRLVIDGDAAVTDDTMFALIDSGRR